MRSITALFWVVILFTITAQGTNEPGTTTEHSQARAHEVLNRAVKALGGSASLQGMRAVRYRYEGQTWERLQMQTLEPPFEPNTQQVTVLIDLANDRLRVDQRSTAPGFDIHNTAVIKEGAAVIYNHITRAAVPTSSLRPFAPHYRRVPQVLLREAMNNTSTLRYLGRDEGAGKPQDVITFVTSRAEQISLYVDASSGLVSKSELILLDPLAGEAAAELAFSDYTRAGPHLVPTTWVESEAASQVGRYHARVEIDPAISDAAFDVPSEGYTFATLPPPPKEEVEQLAEGIVSMRNIAGPNQHSLVVAFSDHLAVVEAPGTSQGTDKLIARIKQAFPGKPIRYVTITHHHGDHVGGLRSFIAEGATVITTPGNRDYVEALARAPQFDRLHEQPRKPEILLIRNGKHVLRDGARTMELIDIGPNPHAQELVIAYLPKERLLFQADVFNMPVTPRPLKPVQPLARSFAERVRKLDLDVDRIVGVHGRSVSASEFSQLTGLEL